LLSFESISAKFRHSIDPLAESFWLRTGFKESIIMRHTRQVSVAAFGAAAAALIAASPAHAAILLCYEGGNDTPQCGSTTSNVLVDKVDGVNVVGGHLNTDPGQLVTFTSVELLNGDGSGQAVVSASDGSLNTWLEFALVDATFNLATFNLNPISGNAPGTPDKATSVEVTYFPTFGGAPITYSLNTNGQNFYGIFGSEGEQLQSIRFTFADGAGISDIRQVRLGGIESAIPEPTTWAMMLLGFGFIGAALRRRRRQSGSLSFA
jgi:hypothetical protein